MRLPTFAMCALIIAIVMLLFPNQLVGAALQDSCDNQLPGDANGDGIINQSDVDFLRDYLTGVGDSPEPPANGDPNGDCYTSPADVEYLDKYVNMDGPAPVECTCVYPVFCNWITGDPNLDGILNISDAVYLISYIFAGGPAPWPIGVADMNCDCTINISDVIEIIRIIFVYQDWEPCDCAEWYIKCGDIQ